MQKAMEAKERGNISSSGSHPHRHVLSMPVPLSRPPESLGLRLSSQEEEQIIVRVKLAPQSNVEGEEVGKIHKEEAVCRFCFDRFEDENILMTKCNCKMVALIHEDCAVERRRSRKDGNFKCEDCEQDIQIVPVTLSMPADKEKFEKPSSTSKRYMRNCFGFWFFG
ncbi:hypothetical protein Salat_0748600 [Sesamum alatum]|uniref:RING-CH-type domain-containing protein n=1 Tax=Sesamum alatum TaxID=300844 RepID=A0AAE1YSW2_9LAMI|nr:hypothetical protein Salat_0748600 [Sesamum alatum]